MSWPPGCAGIPCAARTHGAQLQAVTARVQELQAIFDVIGTPEWACIDAVDSPAWRHFLTRMPAQAPHLMRSFGFAGEPAVDLLRRMLAFDPERRCSAAEAASHEYLAGAVTSAANGPRRSSLLRQSSDASSSMDTDRGEWPSAAGQAERPLRMQPSSTWLRLLDGVHAAAAGALSPEKRRRSSDIGAPLVRRHTASESATGVARCCAPPQHVLAGTSSTLGNCGCLQCTCLQCELGGMFAQRTVLLPSSVSSLADSALAAATVVHWHHGKPPAHAVAAVGDGCDAASSGHARSTTSSAHYADIVEPAAALSALEQELDKLVAHFSERGAPPDAQAICDAICTLIKEECNAEVRASFSGCAIGVGG